jgi:hypothetical protein
MQWGGLDGLSVSLENITAIKCCSSVCPSFDMFFVALQGGTILSEQISA